MNKWHSYIFISVSVILGVSLWILLPVILEFLILGNYRIEILFSAIIIFFFPVTFFSYQNSQRNIREKQLNNDLKILGIQDDGRSSNARSQDNDQQPDINNQENLYHKTHESWRYIVHILLLISLIVLGLFVLFGDLPSNYSGFVTQDLLTAWRFSFVGSYLFSVQLIYRRYTTFDLEPAVYFYSWLNMLAGFVFSFVVFAHFSSDGGASSGIEQGFRGVIAFMFGFFPSLALQYLNRLVYQATSFNRTRDVEIPLSTIEGLNELHLARLRDNAIDNVQNLASADIQKLLVSTPFSAQQVIDWIDQALLYTHLDLGQIANFRSASVRSLSGFRNWWKNYLTDTLNVTDEIRRSMAQQVRSTPEQLDTIYTVTDVGSNTHYVIPYWTNVKIFTSKIQEGYVTTLPEYLINNLEDLGQHTIVEVERDPKLRNQINRIKELNEQIELVSGKTNLTSALAYLGRALIHYVDGKYDLSQQDIDAGLEIDNKTVGLYRLRIQIYEDTKQFNTENLKILSKNLESIADHIIRHPNLTSKYVESLNLVIQHSRNVSLPISIITKLELLQKINSIYISYRRTYTPLTLYFRNELEKIGYHIILGDELVDASIEPIDFSNPEVEWRKFLVSTLRHVKNYIFIHSPDFLGSAYIPVEIDHAREFGKIIIPILIKQGDMFMYSESPLGSYNMYELNIRRVIEYQTIVDSIYKKLSQRTIKDILGDELDS